MTIDVSEMSREELEEALIQQTQVAQRMKMQRDKYFKGLEDLHAEYLQLGQDAMAMRRMAQQIIMVGTNGQDSVLQAAPLARPEDT